MSASFVFMVSFLFALVPQNRFWSSGPYFEGARYFFRHDFMHI